jgi:hypothetical protein
LASADWSARHPEAAGVEALLKRGLVREILEDIDAQTT